MTFQPKVYTMGHTLGMTGMVALASLGCYGAGLTSDDPGMRSFTEDWLLLIGGGATLLIFLFGLTLLGKPCYDEHTNQQLKAEYDRAMLVWSCMSPEEKAALLAVEENRLFQQMLLIQGFQILINQDQMKRKSSGFRSG